LPQLQLMDHRSAFRALAPQALGHVITFLVAAQAGLAENSHGVEMVGVATNGRRPATRKTLDPTSVPDNHFHRQTNDAESCPFIQKTVVDLEIPADKPLKR